MKKRKSMIVFTIIEGLLVAAVVGLYLVGSLALLKLPSLGSLFNLLTAAFSSTNNMLVFAPVVGVAGVSGLLFIIWLIVDIVRKRWLGFLYAILFLLSGASLMLIYPFLIWYINYYHAMPDIYALIVFGVAALAFIVGIIFFIVDIATGKRAKAPKAAIAPKEEEVTPIEEVREKPLIKEGEEENHPTEVIEEEKEEEVVVSQDDIDELNMEEEPKEKEDEKKKSTKKPSPRATQSIMLTNENGQSYVKAYHVSRRPDLNKWQVKATGSSRALKLFNTQKEAIDYANQLTAGTNIPVRVHSKAGKLRKTNN